MTTPGVPAPQRPCRICAQPTPNPGQRCDTHTREHNAAHNQRTAYYQTKEWRELAAHVKQRDHNRCIVCSSTARLAAHHIHPRKQGGADTPTNLVTLCHSCHSLHEAGDPTIQPRIDEHMNLIYKQYEL